MDNTTVENTIDPITELMLNTPIEDIAEAMEKAGLSIEYTPEERQEYERSWEILREVNKARNVFQDVEVEVSNPDELAEANGGKYMESYNIAL